MRFTGRRHAVGVGSVTRGRPGGREERPSAVDVEWRRRAVVQAALVGHLAGACRRRGVEAVRATAVGEVHAAPRPPGDEGGERESVRERERERGRETSYTYYYDWTDA